jgi:hypothetical protein
LEEGHLAILHSSTKTLLKSAVQKKKQKKKFSDTDAHDQSFFDGIAHYINTFSRFDQDTHTLLSAVHGGSKTPRIQEKSYSPSNGFSLSQPFVQVKVIARMQHTGIPH